nr:hypothetical protein [Tanacetum cinerariifolium]
DLGSQSQPLIMVCVKLDHNPTRLISYKQVGLTFWQLGEVLGAGCLLKQGTKGTLGVGEKDSAQSLALSGFTLTFPGLTLTFPGLTFVDLGL